MRLLLLWFLSGCSLFGVAQMPDGVLRLTMADRVALDAHAAPPVQGAVWDRIALPDNWNFTRPGSGDGVWYRFQITLPYSDAPAPRGVLLRNVSSNAEIWWDGALIASGGRMDEPLARNWNRPLYAVIPYAESAADTHVLHIYVRGYPNDGAGLGIVFVGPDLLLRAMYEDTLFAKHTLSVMGLMFTMVIACGVLLLFMLRPENMILKWMLIASLFWAVVLVNFVVREPWLPRFYWEILVAQAPVDFYALALLILVHRILAIERKRLEWALGGVLLVGWLIILGFGSNASITPWSMPLHTEALLASFYVIWICVQQWLQQRDTQAAVLGIAVTPEVLLGFHDWWTAYPGNQTDQMMLMHLGPPIALFIIGLWMLFRFVKSMRYAENHKQRMELAVIQAAEDLKLEQAKLVKLEHQRLIDREQERFSRELHEGVGGHLVALSGQLHDGIASESQIADMVDRALLDMRLIIDIMRDDCSDVGMLLGVLRYRLQLWAKEHGMLISWHMDELEMNCHLAEGQALHFLRIIQDALMNIAGCAGDISVAVHARSETDPCRVYVGIIDASNRLDEIRTHAPSMIAMHEHARQLNATLQLRPASAPDATLLLCVPVRTV